MQVKIGDFGLACLGDFGAFENSSSAPVSVSNSPNSGSVSKSYGFVNQLSPTETTKGLKFDRENVEHTKGVGTGLYASPEQLSGKHYDMKVIEMHFSFYSFLTIQ